MGCDARLIGVLGACACRSGLHSLLLPPLGHGPLQLLHPKSAHALRGALQRARQDRPGRLHYTLHVSEESAVRFCDIRDGLQLSTVTMCISRSAGAPSSCLQAC